MRMNRETAGLSGAAHNKVLSALAIVAFASPLSAARPADRALTTIREIRVSVLVSQSTVGGRSSDEIGQAVLERVEGRLRAAGVAIVIDPAAPRLLFHFDGPDLCDEPGKSSSIIHLSAELLDRVTISRPAGVIETHAILWNATDIDICAVDQRAASLTMVERAVAQFLEALGIDAGASETAPVVSGGRALAREVVKFPREGDRARPKHVQAARGEDVGAKDVLAMADHAIQWGMLSVVMENATEAVTARVLAKKVLTPVLGSTLQKALEKVLEPDPPFGLLHP